MNERTVHLGKLKRHHDKEWRYLYDLLADRLFLFGLYQLGKDRDLAREALQETFLRATKTIVHYEGLPEELSHWLCGIMKNVAREIRRREWRWTTSEREDDSSVLSENFVDPRPQPDERLLARERYRLLGAALASLPANWEAALRLKYLEELTVEETAQRMGLTFKAAESLLARARMGFQEVFSNLAEASYEDTRKADRI